MGPCFLCRVSPSHRVRSRWHITSSSFTVATCCQRLLTCAQSISSRGESGWCSDRTSTPGAWRHAEAQFLLLGDTKGSIRQESWSESDQIISPDTNKTSSGNMERYEGNRMSAHRHMQRCWIHMGLARSEGLDPACGKGVGQGEVSECMYMDMCRLEPGCLSQPLSRWQRPTTDRITTGHHPTQEGHRELGESGAMVDGQDNSATHTHTRGPQ